MPECSLRETAPLKRLGELDVSPRRPHARSPKVAPLAQYAGLRANRARRWQLGPPRTLAETNHRPAR